MDKPKFTREQVAEAIANIEIPIYVDPSDEKFDYKKYMKDSITKILTEVEIVDDTDR